MNCIAPGPVDTKLFQSGAEGLRKGGEKNYQDMMKTKDANPPEFINDLALFLAAVESEYVTGKMISPIWDDWRNLNKTLSNTDDLSLFTLRRIDEMIYTKVK